MIKSLLASYKKWQSKSSQDKRKAILLKLKSLSLLPFAFGKANFMKIYLAYLPDSHIYFNAHPESKTLFKQFKRFNAFNSGDSARFWSFLLNIKQVMSEGIEGDFAELGVWRGNTAAILAYYAGINHRKLYLFDTYEGFSNKDLKGIDNNKFMDFSETSIELVKEVVHDTYNVASYIKGYFPDTIEEIHRSTKYSIVSLDCDLYEPTKAGLSFFYPLMSKGGIIFLHDYSSMFWDGSKKAIDDFCKANNEFVILMPDKSGSAFIRKTQ